MNNNNNNKIKEKVFPKTDKINNLKYDTEGLYSISHPIDADYISKIIIKFLDNKKDLHIFEGTAGLGGNILSFCKFFSSVHGVEIDNERFKLLENNISCYNYNNVKLSNGNCIDFFSNKYDVFFFDPPWGGPKYKAKDSINLYLGKSNLNDIVKMIPKNKCVVFKVPYNFNLNLLKDYELTIKKIRNILIILLIS